MERGVGNELQKKRLANLRKSYKEMLNARKSRQTPQLNRQIETVGEKIRKITESNSY